MIVPFIFNYLEKLPRQLDISI